MQQTVTFNNTQEVVSVNMSSTTTTLHTNSISPKSINPQLLSNTQSNDLPYSLASTIIKHPVPSNIPLETPTTPPQLLLRKKFQTLP
ncbi:hypothetical protein O181_092735 [Austropuccinia psidii MF-1]|uniref:Uncharacterized protein n=1 Tax=Austropuccinia psidii MF-1 TaxID=1389203 RepID=A0A9Q3IZ52_9BASI|nr:hypothetical protein [Austropuccinia psidii MF-1]